MFQLQAERILCIQRLAAQSLSDGKIYLSFTASLVSTEKTSLTVLRSAGTSASVPIHWYIMTSPFTDEATRKYFESHKYFGLEADQVKEKASLYSSFCHKYNFAFDDVFSLNTGHFLPTRYYTLRFKGREIYYGDSIQGRILFFCSIYYLVSNL